MIVGMAIIGNFSDIDGVCLAFLPAILLALAVASYTMLCSCLFLEPRKVMLVAGSLTGLLYVLHILSRAIGSLEWMGNLSIFYYYEPAKIASELTMNWVGIGVSLGWMGIIILLCHPGCRSWLGRSLAAVGRMALSNYLLHSLVCTFIFYGFGLGLYGSVERIGQIGIVVPGLLRDFDGPVPEHLTRVQKSGIPFWQPECCCFHTAAWWRNLWKRTGQVDVETADVLPDGWRDWLQYEQACDEAGTLLFPSEAEALAADAGRYLALLRVVAKRV